LSGFAHKYRQARARQRFMRGPSTGGLGLTIGALVVVIAIAMLLGFLDRRARERTAQRLEGTRAAATDPIALVAEAARTHRILLLGDVQGANAPKRFAADVIDTLARGPGLDVVALEIDVELQPRIDAYLDAREEDASLLLARPRSVREWEGTGRAFLEIFRRVRALNARLGASRRIRIVALDAPGWPPTPPPSPARLAQRYAERGEHMARSLEQRVLERDDRARVLVFVDGLHTLRARIRIETGGVVLDSVPLLAARIAPAGNVAPFAVLVGAEAPPTPGYGLAGYRPGAFFERMAGGSADGAAFGFLVRPGLPFGIEDVEWWRGPGVSIEIVPLGGPLPLVDAWVRLSGQGG